MSETRDTAQRISLRAIRARQREEFGGVNWGAAFFGWLVAIGLEALLGAEYNVLEGLNLPALPVGDAELVSGGALALALVGLGTLLAAVVGGKRGEHYHRTVDRAGFAE
jgi:hypothetical protein